MVRLLARHLASFSVLFHVFHLGVESVQEGTCNGEADFCGLSIYDFTFAATHNAGSYSLSNPKKFDVAVAGEALKKCYYENHNYDVVRQLNNGVRAFSIDFCGRKADLGTSNPREWLCHGSYDDEDLTAFGDDLRKYLAQVKTWLTVHDREVISLIVENTKSTTRRRWQAAVESVFGACVDSEGALSSSLNPVSLGCMWLEEPTSNRDNLTLGHMIASGRRVLVTRWRDTVVGSWDPDANTGVEVDNDGLFRHLSAWSKSKSGTPLLAWYVFSTIRAKVPELNPKSILSMLGTSQLDVRCNSHMAEHINSFFFPADTAGHVHPSEGNASCDGMCGCLGYKSKLEALHQRVLDNGDNIMFILADYTMYGHVADTVRRMNFATLRRRQGQMEQATPVHQCTWFIATTVSASVVLVLTVVLGCCCCLSRRSRRDALCCLCRRRARRAKKNRNSKDASTGGADCYGQSWQEHAQKYSAPTAACGTVPSHHMQGPGFPGWQPQPHQQQPQTHWSAAAPGLGGQQIPGQQHQQSPWPAQGMGGPPPYHPQQQFQQQQWQQQQQQQQQWQQQQQQQQQWQQQQWQQQQWQQQQQQWQQPPPLQQHHLPAGTHGMGNLQAQWHPHQQSICPI